MINRRMMIRSLIAAMFVALLSVISTQNAAAQWLCKCDYITVSASSDIRCKFELCVESAAGLQCETIVPGSQTIFKCLKEANIWVTDCQGKKVLITADCDLGQTQIIAISPDCCIELCVTRGADGCLYIKIWAAKAPCAKC